MAPEAWAVLDLDDADCSALEVAGAKASALHRARASGLPVLQGYVVTTATARPALRAADAALAARGSGGARLAAQSSPLPAALHARLAKVVASLGEPVIVRSSATVEGAGEWSGALSSFADVDAETVATAIKGCWASLFAVDVLERAVHAGVETQGVDVAVLIQPLVAPRVSGHARLSGSDVQVTAVDGSPGGLMSGWVSGQTAMVSSEGDVSGAPLTVLSAEEARAVADLVRRCVRLLDHHSVEWALVERDLVLLQSNPGIRSPQPEAPTVARLEALDHPSADLVADLVRRFPGGICEDLLLPWALGLRDLAVLGCLDEALPFSASGDPVEDVDDIERDAVSLAESVWRAGNPRTAAPWRTALRALRGDRPEHALAQIASLRPPPAEHAVRLLRRLLAVGQHAALRGILRRPEEILDCERADLAPHRAQLPRQSWAGARRWEPFLAAVAQTRGTTVVGTAAAAGLGAGTARAVDVRQPIDHASPARRVVVATHPVPALAPLLWNAAGLVTTQGSAGAHLIEVARSLGVPAVVACQDLCSRTFSEKFVFAVDGDRGQVSWHRLASTSRSDQNVMSQDATADRRGRENSPAASWSG